MVHVPSWLDTRFAPAPGGTDGFRQPGPCSRQLAAPWWKVMEASKVLEFRRVDPALWAELAYSLCGEGEGGRRGGVFEPCFEGRQRGRWAVSGNTKGCLFPLDCVAS